MWRTVESNHADPALLITNPVILAACRAPFAPQFPCTVPLAYLGVGLRGDKEKRNSLYGQITDIIPCGVLFYNLPIFCKYIRNGWHQTISTACILIVDKALTCVVNEPLTRQNQIFS